MKPIYCGLNGKWSISQEQLPLRCIAPCREDVVIKGRKKKMGTEGYTFENVIKMEMAFEEKHCNKSKSSEDGEPEGVFAEGKTRIFAT